MKPGDLLVSLHKDIVGYDVGDVVVWCSNPTYCTVHRVVELSGSQVVTKGDNNPSEDPPIPESYVRYRVVLIIPLIAWLPACLACMSLYLIKEREKLLRLARGFGDVEMIVFFVLTIINLALVALVPLHHFTTEPTLVKPSMSLRSVEILEPGSLILVRYGVQNLKLVSVAGCLVEVGDQVLGCSAYIPTSDSVAVVVPPETYAVAYKEGLTSFKVLVNLTLDKGFLVGSYPLHISWSKLGISVSNNSLILSNPNYLPINVTQVRVTYMSYDKWSRTHKVTQVKELEGFTVSPKNTYVLLIEGRGEYAYVMIKYLFMGEEVVEQRRIDFS